MSVYMGTTKIDVSKTLGEISKVLVKAGATQISTDYKSGGVAAVRFTLQVAGYRAPVAFRLPCRTEKILKHVRCNAVQAERTAWRQVLRWVQAQIAMTDAGLAPVHEVFMPYAILPGGEDTTMFQQWEGHMQKQLPGAGAK